MNRALTDTHKILLLCIYILVANIFVYLIAPPYIVNILVVYLPPTVLTLYQLRRSRKKILIFSFISLLLFAPPVELISRLADAWDVASIFPRLFGTAPIENLVYAFFNFLWPLSFYELFIDKDSSPKISNRWKFLVSIYIIFSFVVFTIFSFNKEILSMEYWKVGAVLMIPALFVYAKNPRLLKKVILPTVFFGFAFFFNEVISMELGHWWWPGEYLWTVDLLGNKFPIDDAIIWYVLSTPMLIAGYEFFMDDEQ